MIGCDFLDSGRFVKISAPKTPRSQASSIPTTTTVAGTSATTDNTTSSSSSSSTVPKVRPVGCKTIFIKNLPYNATEAEIKEVFQVCGPIINVRLASWGHTQATKGFGKHLTIYIHMLPVYILKHRTAVTRMYNIHYILYVYIRLFGV